MKYQIGEVKLDNVTSQTIIRPNKTRKYLLPCLRDYGDEFITKLNSVYKVAVGLGDMVITKRYYKIPERHLFILLDSKIAHSFFKSFLEWIRDHKSYEDDYVYGNIQKSTYHMVVIRFPERFYDAFDAFNSGKYSEMFDVETIKTYFIGSGNENAPKVLIKDHNYKIAFTRKLNKIFNATIDPMDYDGELDLPPKQQEEVFE